MHEGPIAGYSWPATVVFHWDCKPRAMFEQSVIAQWGAYFSSMVRSEVSLLADATCCCTLTRQRLCVLSWNDILSVCVCPCCHNKWLFIFQFDHRNHELTKYSCHLREDGGRLVWAYRKMHSTAWIGAGRSWVPLTSRRLLPCSCCYVWLAVVAFAADFFSGAGKFRRRRNNKY